METQVKLTKLASCAGCGAKVGAGTLAAMLEGFRTHTDPRLIVGYDKSDDACVYVVDPQTALVQTTDFFPPIVDDPFLYGQIAAANALSGVYAMGGEPKLALNILCLPETIGPDTVRELLRGGYDKVYEAGAVIAGGHIIHGAEPIYGLAVTGFGLLGHSFEMAQGSSCTIHLTADQVPYHPETLELADMGFLPAGAYRNRSYAEAGVTCRWEIPRPLMDLFFDPQTSGGLLIALPETAARDCLAQLRDAIPSAACIGYVTAREDSWIVLE